jgi:tetratricopeptide (TPR) repeat protein
MRAQFRKGKTMAAPAIAIDFGTTRTKVAYYDAVRGEPRLIEIGREIRAIVPSTFYIPPDGQGDRLVGDDAQDQWETDPEGVVIGLKKEIHRLGKKHFGPGRRSVDRIELASDMFGMIRRKCRELVFHSEVDRCVLTVPVMFEEQKRECIRQAAQLGGFRDVKVVEEPVSAAQAWLAQSVDKFGDQVIVCDVGGGTTDWALLQYVDHRFEQVPEVPPVGSTMGGNDVDEDIFEELLCLQSSDFDRDLAVRQKAGFLIRLRRLRERLTQEQGPEFPIKVDAIRMRVPRGVVEQRTEEFVSRVKQETQRFLARCRQVGTFEGCPLLLVGGASRLPGLKESLEALAPPGPVFLWNDSDYATVLGAVEQPSIKPREAPAAPDSTKSDSSDGNICSAQRIHDMVGDGECEKAFEMVSKTLAADPDEDIFDLWLDVGAAVPDGSRVLGRAREIHRIRHGDMWSVSALAVALTQVNRRDEAKNQLAPAQPDADGLPYPLQIAWLEMLSQDTRDPKYRSLLDRLLQARSNNSRLLTHWAFTLVNYKESALVENDQVGHAWDLLDLALRLNPSCIEALLARSLLALRKTATRERPAALTALRADLSAIERIAKDHVFAHLARGAYRFATSDFQGAKSEFDRATGDPRLMANPENFAGVLVFRSLANVALKDAAAARWDAGEAARRCPTSVEALFLQGRFLLEDKRLQEGLACFDRGLALAPSAVEGLLGRGEAHFRLGRFEQAAKDFEEAAKRDTGNAAAVGRATLSVIRHVLGVGTEELRKLAGYLFIHPDIPSDKISTAMSTLGQLPAGDKMVLLLYDASPRRALDQGFYISERHVVSKASPSQKWTWQLQLQDAQSTCEAKAEQDTWTTSKFALPKGSPVGVELRTNCEYESVVLPMPDGCTWNGKQMRASMGRVLGELGRLHRRLSETVHPEVREPAHRRTASVGAAGENGTGTTRNLEAAEVRVPGTLDNTPFTQPAESSTRDSWLGDLGFWMGWGVICGIWVLLVGPLSSLFVVGGGLLAFRLFKRARR